MYWWSVVAVYALSSGPLPAVGPSRPRIDRHADTHNADTLNAPNTKDYEMFTDFYRFFGLSLGDYAFPEWSLDGTLLLPRCSGPPRGSRGVYVEPENPPGWFLGISIGKYETDPDQKLPLTRLQTPWEQNDRVPLGEYYTFDVAIPRKDEFGQHRRHALGRRHVHGT